MADESLSVTYTEAGRILGLSRATIQRRVKAGTIPSVSLGGGWKRILRADLDAMIKRAQQEPVRLAAVAQSINRSHPSKKRAKA